MRTRSFLILLTAASAAAFWTGTRLARTDPPPSPAQLVVEHAAQLPAPRGLDREDVRAAIREELGRQKAAEATVQPAAPAASVVGANAIIADGIRDGTWSAAERDALRAELVHLGPAELDDVLSPLFQAINAQRVRLDGRPI